jgi:soluble lytic murein transglycosylase-like protein
MKAITHSKCRFHNYYELLFIPLHIVVIYLSKITLKIESLQNGTLFDGYQDKRNGKEMPTSARFKMGELAFARKLKLNQTLRYGAAVYLMAAMTLIPAGICNSQYRAIYFRPAVFAPDAAMPDFMTESASAPSDPSGLDSAGDEASVQADATEAAPPFDEHILQAAKTYHVDAALIRAIIMAESNYNPRAVSHRGAQGLMQLMPTTAKWLGVQDSFDPALNIDAGVRYFKKLLERFDNNVKLALAAYNAGSRYVLKYGGVPPFRATRVYIRKVLKYHRKLIGETAAFENGPTTS